MIYRSHRRFLLVILVTLFFPATSAFSGEALIAVAANFSAPAKAIARTFQEESGHKIKLTFGSTGKLYTQIISGAPFDVFLAADAEKPELLETRGLAVSHRSFTYAIGKIVLYSADPDLVDTEGNVLSLHHRFAHLAIANPETAPYGKAAIQTLKALGHYDQLKGRIVKGENISQTYQYVATRNAQLGFVAFSQTGTTPSGSMWIVPQSLYSPIEQQAALLVRGKGNKAAVAFFEFLNSDKARKVIKSYGYEVN